MSFACLSCCKSFKRSFDNNDGAPSELVCPECSGPSYNFCRHFKPPKKTDNAQWEKIRFLFEHGFWFQKIRIGKGNKDEVAYPETLHEAKEFVAKYKQYAIQQDK
jgi:hypothetical protein